MENGDGCHVVASGRQTASNSQWEAGGVRGGVPLSEERQAIAGESWCRTSSLGDLGAMLLLSGHAGEMYLRNVTCIGSRERGDRPLWIGIRSKISRILL